MSTGQTPAVESEEFPIGKIEIDFLIVADWAETINGKLYIQGGGWDRKLKPPSDRPISFAMAAGILVPWHLTNRQHAFSLTLETGDGGLVGPAVTGGFTMGRPVEALPGQKFRTPFAARIDVRIPGLGAYDVKLVVNNDITKVTTFYVVEKL